MRRVAQFIKSRTEVLVISGGVFGEALERLVLVGAVFRQLALVISFAERVVVLKAWREKVRVRYSKNTVCQAVNEMISTHHLIHRQCLVELHQAVKQYANGQGHLEEILGILDELELVS